MSSSESGTGSWRGSRRAQASPRTCLFLSPARTGIQDREGLEATRQGCGGARAERGRFCSSGHEQKKQKQRKEKPREKLTSEREFMRPSVSARLCEHLEGSGGPARERWGPLPGGKGHRNVCGLPRGQGLGGASGDSLQQSWRPPCVRCSDQTHGQAARLEPHSSDAEPHDYPRSAHLPAWQAGRPLLAKL